MLLRAFKVVDFLISLKRTEINIFRENFEDKNLIKFSGDDVLN